MHAVVVVLPMRQATSLSAIWCPVAHELCAKAATCAQTVVDFTSHRCWVNFLAPGETVASLDSPRIRTFGAANEASNLESARNQTTTGL
jgi:hypothetical protein